METVENTTISTRITMKEKTKIIKIVNQGEYLNISDFSRQAIREKLARIGDKQ